MVIDTVRLPDEKVVVRAVGARRTQKVIMHLLLIAAAVVLLYPLFWVLGSSVKPDTEIFKDASLWPKHFIWHNYVAGWSAFGTSFATYFQNSFVVCILSVIGNVFSCSCAAYAFARLEFRFKRLWFALMMATIMLPVHVTLIPQYILFKNLGWINTFLPLVVPKFFGTDAFFVFLMVQFIRGIPRDLDDAAHIDGCGPLATFRYIVFPLMKPAIVTTAIFTFIWTYNDFFSQLIYLNSPTLYTVPLGLRQFLDNSGESTWGPMFAMSVLALMPVFLIFVVFQRLVVQGIATTGLKG
jgi:multiple sugar transport system permease protein